MTTARRQGGVVTRERGPAVARSVSGWTIAEACPPELGANARRAAAEPSASERQRQGVGGVLHLALQVPGVGRGQVDAGGPPAPDVDPERRELLGLVRVVAQQVEPIH